MLLNRREDKPARRTADLPLNAVFAIAQIAAFLCMIVMQCLNAAAEKVVFLILSLALWGVMSPGLLSRSGPLCALFGKETPDRVRTISAVGVTLFFLLLAYFILFFAFG